MERIAAEAPITKVAIHYHCDTKEALLNAFLDAVCAPDETGEEAFPVALGEPPDTTRDNDYSRLLPPIAANGGGDRW